MSYKHSDGVAAIPMRSIGPVAITGPVLTDQVMVPLATYESPLWPSTQRGAATARRAGGVRAVLIDERMTRSILLEADSVVAVDRVLHDLKARKEELAAVIRATSRFATLQEVNGRIVGSLLFVRLEITTGDAAGHNMVTLAADRMISWILAQYPELRYVSISGNYCTDKKVSAVNAILGRGHHVVAEALIPGKICRRYLKTTARAVTDLVVKKNLVGSILAGSLGSANAHFANMLLAFYLATGQDAANIVEGSQGLTYAEARGDDLYFSVTLPNIIVGTVGNGKGLDFVQRNLAQMGCLEPRDHGQNAARLAAIAAATVLCGELSLLAAQTNPGELMKAHTLMERSNGSNQ